MRSHNSNNKIKSLMMPQNRHKPKMLDQIRRNHTVNYKSDKAAIILPCKHNTIYHSSYYFNKKMMILACIFIIMISVATAEPSNHLDQKKRDINNIRETPPLSEQNSMVAVHKAVSKYDHWDSSNIECFPKTQSQPYEIIKCYDYIRAQYFNKESCNTQISSSKNIFISPEKEFLNMVQKELKNQEEETSRLDQEIVSYEKSNFFYQTLFSRFNDNNKKRRDLSKAKYIFYHALLMNDNDKTNIDREIDSNRLFYSYVTLGLLMERNTDDRMLNEIMKKIDKLDETFIDEQAVAELERRLVVSK